MNDSETSLKTERTIHNDEERRFGGIERLYGRFALDKLKSSHVCVIGIGGVGSWLVESLARSAVGEITIIDMDLVAVSNINRQLLANSDTIGRDKVEVMQERVKKINPLCCIHAVDEFIDKDNMHLLLSKKFDYVVDCIDDFRTKAAMISYCRSNKIRILTTGGAGGQSDPSQIRLCDLSRTNQDVLLAKTRKLLRQEYGFSRNLKRSFGVPCVYSEEQPIYPDGEGGLTVQRPNRVSSSDKGVSNTLNALNCAGGLGSVTHVTATFALFASAHVVKQLSIDE